jgi:hypothetical protein
MRKGRRTEITVETHRTLRISVRSRRSRLFCPGCAAEVEMVSADVAARVAGLSEREVFRLVESGGLHHTGAPDGRLLVCLNALADKGSEKK